VPEFILNLFVRGIGTPETHRRRRVTRGRAPAAMARTMSRAYATHTCVVCLACVCFFALAVDARSTGAASCDARSGHGAGDSGDGGFTLTTTDGSVDVTAVAPNTTVSLTLASPPGGLTFDGFVVHSGNSGVLAVADGGSHSQTASPCHAGNSVTHKSRIAKSSVDVAYTTSTTPGTTTLTAQFVTSKMIVFQTTMDVTVTGGLGVDGDDDDKNEDGDDDVEVQIAQGKDTNYQFVTSLASDTTLQWTVGPADASADGYVPAVADGDVSFQVTTTRADASQVSFSFQQTQNMVPAYAVVGWLPNDGVGGQVGSYYLAGYSAEEVVVDSVLGLRNASVSRVGSALSVSFVVSKADVATALGSGTTADDLFEAQTRRRALRQETAVYANVAYAVSSVSTQHAYHDLGRGAFAVDLGRGGDGVDQISASQKMRKLRFFCHGACALAGLYAMTAGGYVAAFRLGTGGGSILAGGGDGSNTMATSQKPATTTARKFVTKYWFVAHRACQYAGSVFVVVAAILALVPSSGESKNTLKPFDWEGRGDVDGGLKAHGVLGILLVTLVSAQVLTGIFREQKGGGSDAADDDGTGDVKASGGEDDASGKTTTKSTPTRNFHRVVGWVVFLAFAANCVTGTALGLSQIRHTLFYL
jgi:hypothetical protein